MTTKTLRNVCFYLGFTLLAAGVLHAQGPPSGNPGAPGGPGGPGGPGHPAAPPPTGPGYPGSNPNAPRGSNPKKETAAPPRNALQFGPVGRWWDDKSVSQQIGLRREQQKKMDSIFDANRSAIVASYKAFLKAQSNLAAINKDPNADKNTVFSAIDAVNNARSDLQKATSSMLLEIRKEMEPTQIDKLEKLP